MTRDDIRKLIGGYATGTLTEAERTLLFEAALDDQELFDELAREQSLKELLDEPGAKQRLIARLAEAKPERVWWRRPIAWTATGLLAAAAAALVVVSWKPVALKPVVSAPVSAERALSEPVQPEPVPPEPATATPAGKPTAPPPGPQVRSVAVMAPAAAEKKAASLPPVEKAAGVPQGVSAAAGQNGPVKQEADRKEKDADQRTEKADQVAASGRQEAAAQTAPPPQAAEQFVQNAVPAPLQGPSQAQAQAPAPGAQSRFGAVGGARAGKVAPATRVAALAARSRFAFDYSLQANRNLVITAFAGGYLSVTAAAPQAFRRIYPEGGDGQQVAAGSTTRIAIPAEVHSVVIVFSASAAGRADGKAVMDAISSVRDASSGTVEDPNPSPNSRLVVEVKIQP